MDFIEIDNKEHWARKDCLRTIDVFSRCKETYCSVLHIALKNQADVSVIKHFIDNKINLHAKDYIGMLPIHYMAKYINNLDYIDQINIESLDLESEDDEGNTVLHVASRYNTDVDVINFFICNIDYDKQNNNGATAIFLAAKYNSNPEILNTFVLNNHIDVNVRDKDNKCALDYAKKNKALIGTRALYQLRDKTENYRGDKSE